MVIASAAKQSVSAGYHVSTLDSVIASLRQLVEAAAQRLGPVEVDHGDTACKTPEVLASLEKAWIQARAKGFASPAEQERARESPRRR